MVPFRKFCHIWGLHCAPFHICYTIPASGTPRVGPCFSPKTGNHCHWLSYLPWSGKLHVVQVWIPVNIGGGGGGGGVSTLGLQQQSCKFVPLIPRCWAGWRALHTKGTCKLPERSLHQCSIHWPTLHTAPVLMLGIHLVSLAFGGYA